MMQGLSLLLTIIIAAPVLGTSIADAQQAMKVPAIGVLTSSSLSPARLQAFRQGLRDMGYVEGQDIAVEYRSAEGRLDQLPDLAAELVRHKVDVIVAAGTVAIRAAQSATRSVPIVMTHVGDPVAMGFVASLGRPSGNITGLTILAPELSGKRLELLKEVVPRVSRVAVLWNPANPSGGPPLKVTRGAAADLGIQLQVFGAQHANEIQGAFFAMLKERTGAISVLPDAMLFAERKLIVDVARKSRLPAIYYAEEFAEAGGLMAYGPSYRHNFRRAAYFVHKILKGTKPADLPVEQPNRFELAINLRTAKEVGIAIPSELLILADKVLH